MSAAPLPVRSDLVDLQPYVSPQRPARYKMNTNESPYPPPAGVVTTAVRDLEATRFNRYPDGDASRLLDALESHTGRGRDSIWVANGSNELFLHLLLAYGGAGRTVLTFEPTYPVHSLIARITGTRVVALERDAHLDVPVDEALALIDREGPELVIVCSPNNPTGNPAPAGTVRALVDAAPGLVVVDEAYVEFAPEGTSVAPLLDRAPGLVVTRTFSKAWRLAGARLGYLFGDPAIVDGLRKVRLPYHLSSPSQVLGAAALAHAPEALEAVNAIVEQREALIEGLGSRGLAPYPSAANFVLFRVPDADAVWDALLQRGVLVRNYSTSAGLRGCLRVTAGLPEETDAFFDALDDVLEGRGI